MKNQLVKNPLIQRKPLHGRRGAAALELAVAMPLFFLFLFGVVEFGRILSVSHTVNAAAREGARIAALSSSSNADVITVVQNELSQSGLSLESVEFTPTDISTANPNQPVTIRVRISYANIGMTTGFFPALLGSEMQGTVVMRKEGIGS